MNPVILRPATPADADWIVARHAALYARDEGFDDSFRVMVEGIVAAFFAGQDPQNDAGWIACAGARRVGSIFCERLDPQTAKLRLFLVEPEHRGTGLAQSLLDTVLDFARQIGCRRIRLWTHESHAAAGRLYARNGFALTGTEAVHSFGRRNVEQTWEKTL